MKTTILQTDIAWAAPQENIKRVERLMTEAAPDSTEGTLFVLPEMWATGFCVEPQGIAEDEERSAALAWMKHTARSRGCAISGSLAVRTGEGKYRNRHYLVTPDAVVYYDKHHLFRHGGEDTSFTAGTEAVVAEWKGLRLLLQTCYDLRFPVFSRYGRNVSSPFTPSLSPLTSHFSPLTSYLSPLIYDAIIYVANWPAKRQLAWDTLIRARAIENQCYVLAVNRVGSDSACEYCGGSAIIDPLGRTVDTCENKVFFVTADIDINDITKARNRFRVLDDRDLIKQRLS